MENNVIDAVTLGGSVAPLDFSIWALFLRADIVVKLVIIFQLTRNLISISNHTALLNAPL
ncbi:hypothetical protein LCGC14_2025920, partial [marine sediment metagenome]